MELFDVLTPSGWVRPELTHEAVCPCPWTQEGQTTHRKHCDRDLILEDSQHHKEVTGLITGLISPRVEPIRKSVTSEQEKNRTHTRTHCPDGHSTCPRLPDCWKVLQVNKIQMISHKLKVKAMAQLLPTSKPQVSHT